MQPIGWKALSKARMSLLRLCVAGVLLLMGLPSPGWAREGLSIGYGVTRLSATGDFSDHDEIILDSANNQVIYLGKLSDDGTGNILVVGIGVDRLIALEYLQFSTTHTASVQTTNLTADLEATLSARMINLKVTVPFQTPLLGDESELFFRFPLTSSGKLTYEKNVGPVTPASLKKGSEFVGTVDGFGFGYEFFFGGLGFEFALNRFNFEFTQGQIENDVSRTLKPVQTLDASMIDFIVAYHF